MWQDKYRMDSKSAEEIKNQIEHLAAAYVSEGNFDTSNPEINSVMSFFAEQIEKNTEQLNLLPQKCHEKLVNLKELSPLPMRPAEATVVLDLLSKTEEGMELSTGSRFFAEEGEEKIVFETQKEAYLTPAKLKIYSLYSL